MRWRTAFGVALGYLAHVVLTVVAAWALFALLGEERVWLPLEPSVEAAGAHADLLEQARPRLAPGYLGSSLALHVLAALAAGVLAVRVARSPRAASGLALLVLLVEGGGAIRDVAVARAGPPSVAPLAESGGSPEEWDAAWDDWSAAAAFPSWYRLALPLLAAGAIALAARSGRRGARADGRGDPTALAPHSPLADGDSVRGGR